MKRTFMSMMAALAITLLPGVRVVAEEITFASHAEIMSVLERQNTRIAELEAALANGGGGCGSCDSGCCDSCCDSACDSCCDGCCDPCCRPAGIIGSAEVTFLKPHTGIGMGVVDDFAFGYEVAPRVTVGYQGSDGLGYRLRYWEFNHTQRDPGGFANDEVAYDTYVVDLEFVDSMSLGCYWDASIFGGFRYLEFGVEYNVFAANGQIAAGSQSYGNSSIGLTLGGELRRCIGNGLAAYVNTRTSLMMGDEKEFRVNVQNGPAVLNDTELDNIYYIWEAQTGAQWTRELEMGGYLFFRAGVEIQIWDNMAGSGPAGVNGQSTEDWGLGGGTISAGIIR